MPSVYVAREREPTSIPIEEVLREGRLDILPEVQGHEYFDIRFRRDKLIITAGKYIGLIPLNDRVIIQVEPKMPLANILAMLDAVEGDIVELKVLEREYRTAGTVPPQLFAAIANAFIAALRKVEVSGLRKRYERHEKPTVFLRGQIRFRDSVQELWSRGKRHAAICSYSDLTSDGVENRLLRYACHLLLAHHRSTGALRGRVRALGHFEEMFVRSGVRLAFPDPETLSHIHLGESEPAYRSALRLAQLIIARQGIELPEAGTEVALPSFLVDMEALFEKFMRSALARRLTGVEVLDGNTNGRKSLYDNRASPPATPDVVVRRDTQHLIVGDVKYKAAEDRDDINQVVTYAVTYRAPLIALILPAESPSTRGLSLIGVIGGISVYRYRFDLAATNLDSESQALADAVAALLPAADS